MMIIWWSKDAGVILSVLVCDIWINVLLQRSALVGPLYIGMKRYLRIGVIDYLKIEGIGYIKN
jgi:hypothetical protein